MFWLWLFLGIVACVVLVIGLTGAAFFYHLCSRYLDFVVRVFEEKPLFVVPWGSPREDAEDVRFPTENGLSLCGCYLHTNVPVRKGVILFGLEYGSKRFACIPYGQSLLDAGYDVFSFETRSQGESDVQPNYQPLQWVTDYEVADYRAALAYLKQRPDADPRGVGFFGISKGACAGLIAGAKEPYVRCFVTDGVFGTRTTMLPYMRKWVAIVSTRYWLQKVLPLWFYGLIADKALRRISQLRSCVFPHLEDCMSRLAPRPLLMIQGGGDTYIKPEMARSLFKRTRNPKELWIVEGAKHNQSFQVAGAEYAARLARFFDAHLVEPFPVNGAHHSRSAPAPVSRPKAQTAKAESAANRAVAVEHA
ncbi:MAG TPA: alpha/beta fold hydrolase [Gemmataceae bacterium]|nr:alpha/beta fold hydrolase [Gemmataceae bacterium]